MMEARLAQVQATNVYDLDIVGGINDIGDWFENVGDDIEDFAVDSYEAVSDWLETFATETLPSWDAAAENWLETQTEIR